MRVAPLTAPRAHDALLQDPAVLAGRAPAIYEASVLAANVPSKQPPPSPEAPTYTVVASVTMAVEPP